ncbi:MAG: hypothetical protein IKJ77_09305 [Firmicutes bacterium]|nr:hypothetical protein [Bacillota bacterium]
MTKAKRIIVITALAVIFLCGMVYAATSNNANKSFETGVVDITLEEYHVQGGTEAAWSGSAHVMPGTKVSLIPRIKNMGTDCYVRAKIAFRDTNGEITERHITGFSKDWYKADDGYYYYKSVLGVKKTAELFKGLDIPTDIPQSMANKTFYMDITVHAIQSKNFTPDYDMADPWGSVKIVKQEKDGNHDFTVYEESGKSAFEIICKGTSKNIIPELDKLFADIPYLMPGENYSETLKFNNKSNKDINLYFRSVFLHDSDLADKINLKITMTQNGKQKTIYDGPLSGKRFEKNSLLAKIIEGAKGEITFTISVPSELTNTYSLFDSDMKWIFSTKQITDDDIEAVETGDKNEMMLYLATAAIAIVAMFILWAKRRKETEQDEEI